MRTKHSKTYKRYKRGTKHTKTIKKTYNHDDYSSGDGMLTTVWGPSMWLYLHTMSFNYPIHPTIKEKYDYRNFVISLKNVLPCKYCRMNLVKNFKQYPLTMKDMKDRESFSRYIYNLHEMINKMLNKNPNLSYDDVRERYEHFRARCTKDITEKSSAILHKNTNKTRKQKKGEKEKGCTEPLFGKKSKCVLKIVPQDEKIDTFQMDKKCIKIK